MCLFKTSLAGGEGKLLFLPSRESTPLRGINLTRLWARIEQLFLLHIQGAEAGTKESTEEVTRAVWSPQQWPLALAPYRPGGL